MNILFVTDLYPLFEGESGVPRALCDFVEQWKKLGHSVEVFRPNFVPNTLFRGRKLYHDGEYTYNEIKILNKNFLLPFFNYTPKGEWDVVIAHMPTGILAGYDIARAKNLPLVCGVHSSDIAVLDRYPYFGTRLKRAYKECFRVMARSFWLKGEVEKILPEVKGKTFVGLSGVDLNVLVEPKFKGVKKFLTVAQLVGRKNLENLIKAFGLLGGEWSLEVVGEGPLEGRLKRMASDDRVKFCGKLPHKEVLEKMREADVFVLPSWQETLGLVYLEAMACGCITVCGENSGVAGFIKDGVNGFLCGYSAKEIAQKIEEIRSCEGLAGILENAHRDIAPLSKEFAAKKYLEYTCVKRVNEY